MLETAYKNERNIFNFSRENHMNQYAILSFLFCLFATLACSPKEKPYVEKPASTLYRDAYQAMKLGEYKKAADDFDEIERQHPYSDWATKGQLMAAYSSFIVQDYDKTISTLDSFIQLHPGYKDIDYAYYLRALSFYEQILAVSRDQKNTLEALRSLEEVTKRFPKTKYARDAQLKMDFAYDHLAGKEMSVGRYYMKKEFYLAALNRFQVVVDVYQRSTHTPEALHRLVECYLALGLTREAQRVGAVLGHNYPRNEWYADTYLLLKGEDLRPSWVKYQEGSWFQRMN